MLTIAVFVPLLLLMQVQYAATVTYALVILAGTVEHVCLKLEALLAS